MNNDSIDRAIAHFNAGAYRDALLAFEERWFVDRSDFWKALIGQAAQESVHAVVEYVKAHLRGHRGAGGGPSQLTPDQLQLVRTVAEREARRLDISGKRAGLLADAMVGFLTAPPAS